MKRVKSQAVIIGTMAIALSASLLLGSVTNDRVYLLGDHNGPLGTIGSVDEGAVAGNPVGFDTSDGFEITFDSEVDGGSTGLFDFQRLEAHDHANDGSPHYVDITRPNAIGTLGVTFDGINDRLEGRAFNRPDWYWNQTVFASDYPRNYATITNRGTSLWVKPTNVNGARQDILIDSGEFGGVVITANNKWGMAWDMDDAIFTLQNDGIFESDVDVQQDELVHVMQVSLNGTSRGVLFINGVAVVSSFGVDAGGVVRGFAYDAQVWNEGRTERNVNPQPLFVGASDIDGDGNYENFFKGEIDDIEMFLWGDNTGQNDNNGHLGKDWGTFNLMTDNEYIVQQIANSAGLGDLNLDGVLDQADTDIFVANWFTDTTKQLIGMSVVDFDSYKMGDLDMNGIVDIFDAVKFNQAMVAAGNAPLDIASLQVPEPTTLTLLGLGGGLLVRRRRSSKPVHLRSTSSHHRIFAMIALLVTLTFAGTASAIQIELEIRQGSPIGPVGVVSYEGYSDVRMNGNFPTLSAGRDNVFAGDYGNGAVNRGLIRWDLSALAGATVIGDATLSMRVLRADVDPNFTVDIDDYFDLHRIHDTNAGWVENNAVNIVTAVLQPGDPSWNNFTEDPQRPWYDSNGTGDFPGLGDPGDGYATTPEVTFNQANYTAGQNVQTTMPQSVVQDIINGGANHPGFLFRSREEGANPGRLIFDTNKSLHSLTFTVEITPTVLDLEINRATGAMMLNNNTGQAIDILGYQIMTARESLKSETWQPIAGRLDAAGDGTIDSDGEWEVLTAPGSRNNLSEFELDGDGGTIADGVSIDLGSTWIQNPNEDVQMLIALGDGSVVGAWIRYSGNKIINGDLDFDGDLDIDDWLVLKPKFYTDLTGKGLAELYQAGDFNGDEITDETDFGIFKQLYDDANGSGAFEVMVASVPEPASLMLLGLAVVSLRRNRNSIQR